MARTEKRTAEDVMDSLASISGEPTEYLFDIIKQKSRVPLTPERKAKLQSPKALHRRMKEDLYAELTEAITLGE